MILDGKRNFMISKKFRNLLFWQLLILPFGIISVALWIYAAGDLDLLANLRNLNYFYILPLPFITAFCIFIRFIRWQFLLRRVGIRVPTRKSFRIYLASLLGIATPAYIGEVMRCAFLKKKFGTPFSITVFALIIERLTDIAALALIAGTSLFLTRTLEASLGMFLLIFGICFGVLAAGKIASRRKWIDTDTYQIINAKSLFPALCLAVLAWLPTAFIVWFAAYSLDVFVSFPESASAFSSSTLFGGLTLLPAGVTSTGSILIVNLGNFGISIAPAILIVSIVRISTVVLSLAAGFVFFAFELRELQAKPINDSTEHFNDIAVTYEDQFSDHVWSYLLTRKINLIAEKLSTIPQTGIGLDLGCGLGKQCRELKKRGFEVFGIDAAFNLVRQSDVPAIAGDAYRLPFADSSFDFVYTVGVLHHIPGKEGQAIVCREISRILKPSGLFIIHETNPRNPLFRFYMGYVFPLLKTIDEGTEWWIEPAHWKKSAEFEAVNYDYFTFFPDFIPQALLKTIQPVQTWLEKSSFRGFSVHYMVTLQNTAKMSKEGEKISPVNYFGLENPLNGVLKNAERGN